MGDRELMVSLLARFVERTRTQIDDIPRFEKAGDWDSARLNAHTIKGAALTLSGKELGKAAAKTELACKNADMAEMEAAYPLLREAFDRFIKEADAFTRTVT
jgi:HPt (histidine-containing phosphotransfer) domain-containing protein